jgi:ectoine hydroxylase-related dioxygenase (phytanoyl-CoA dioxygenase family)
MNDMERMQSMPAQVREELYDPFTVSRAQVEAFRRDGFIKIPGVLSAAVIAHMDAVISAEVDRLNTQHLAMSERDTYGKAFLQIMNIWRNSEAVREIVFSRRLASIATALLEVSGVRIYHDQALYKEPGGGHTPWHADQYYWPLSSDRTVTAWIPLQETPLELGPLEFSAGSAGLTQGRDKEISDESQSFLDSVLRGSSFPHIVEPFLLGEVSFHTGWTYHRAGPNTTDRMRKVMTMIYMDKDMRLTEPVNPHQQADREAWCKGALVGEVIDTPTNPVIAH